MAWMILLLHLVSILIRFSLIAEVIEVVGRQVQIEYQEQEKSRKK